MTRAVGAIRTAYLYLSLRLGMQKGFRSLAPTRRSRKASLEHKCWFLAAGWHSSYELRCGMSSSTLSESRVRRFRDIARMPAAEAWAARNASERFLSAETKQSGSLNFLQAKLLTIARRRGPSCFRGIRVRRLPTRKIYSTRSSSQWVQIPDT